MFKKSERLGRKAFPEYFKIGRRYHSESFTLVYLPAPAKAVAVVVGKKVHKLAVDRNTLRRRVYAAVRQFLSSNDVTKGVYIIISKPGSKNLTKKAVGQELASLLATTVK